MSAKQGQKYRIVDPADGSRKVIGQGFWPDRLTETIRSEDGTEIIVEDILGDVIYASANVDYPRGPDPQYRHVRWIDEHPKRYQLLKD